MTDAETKHSRTKSVIVEKVKRGQRAHDNKPLGARRTGATATNAVMPIEKVTITTVIPTGKTTVTKLPTKEIATTKMLPKEIAVAMMPTGKATVTTMKPAEKVAAAVVKFPRCDAAVRKMEGDEWELADAILAECSEPGEDGVRNGSQAKMEAMREEIAKTHGVDLSFERIRKLRKVASAFPPGRRRPAVSLEGHLEAGTLEVLDGFIKSAPEGTALTREYIRRLKYPDEKAEQDRQEDERHHQVEDHRAALQNLCRQLEREVEQREQRYTDLCRSIGKEPEPFPPPLSQKEEPSRTVVEGLEQGLRVLLMSRGFDPTADIQKQAIQAFMRAVLAQQQ